ncbi:hypothetical protein J6590_066563 [Homalodisca vitripennis]|nr:hypothetical protein J6590_066563 [Homalodisca vitripennis]
MCAPRQLLAPFTPSALNRLSLKFIIVHGVKKEEVRTCTAGRRKEGRQRSTNNDRVRDLCAGVRTLAVALHPWRRPVTCGAVRRARVSQTGQEKRGSLDKICYSCIHIIRTDVAANGLSTENIGYS